jgi:hypothetical protein
LKTSRICSDSRSVTGLTSAVVHEVPNYFDLVVTHGEQ